MYCIQDKYDCLVPSLVAELKGELFSDDLEIVASSDYNQLIEILDQLAKVKVDPY